MPLPVNPWNNKSMYRLKLFFALFLLVLALPFWRFADMIAIGSPYDWPLTLAMSVWSGIFIAIPLKLIKQKLKVWTLLLVIFATGFLCMWVKPLSHTSTDNSDLGHCGQMTYTGMLYPVRSILTDAYRDDLEARNQMCWVRKIISNVPEKYELGSYIKIIHDKLLKPQIKYRTSLPLIAVLMVKINLGSYEPNASMNVYDSIRFWSDHYTEEISYRNYKPWNWPHSSYIKFEYGLIENNWQKLIDSIVLETK